METSLLIVGSFNQLSAYIQKNLPWPEFQRPHAEICTHSRRVLNNYGLSVLLQPRPSFKCCILSQLTIDLDPGHS